MVTKKIIKAGGGIVSNPDGEILMIFRRGYWDLPKGKLDEGETIEECALREVREECGIMDLRLGVLAGITEHEYIERGDQAIKHTTWFVMQGSGTPKPQAEEDITLARWVPVADIPTLLDAAYPTIATLLVNYLNEA